MVGCNEQPNNGQCSILRELLLCVRDVGGVPVCSCRLHACAHYTALAKPDIPMEGSTKKKNAHKACSETFTLIYSPC